MPRVVDGGTGASVNVVDASLPRSTKLTSKDIPMPTRAPPKTPTGNAAPRAPEASAPWMEVAKTEPEALVMSDRQVLALVVAAYTSPDLSSAEALDRLSDQLMITPARDFHLTALPTIQIAKLFLGIQALAGRVEGSQELAGKVEGAMRERIASMDSDTIMLLGREANLLPPEGRAALHALLTPAMQTLKLHWGRALAEPMVNSAELMSPSGISNAVATAKPIIAALLELQSPTPLTDREKEHGTQDFIRDGLKSIGMTRCGPLQQIFAGKVGTVRGTKAVIKNKSNAVHEAANRQIDGSNSPKNRETINVHLFRRALGSFLLGRDLR